MYKFGPKKKQTNYGLYIILLYTECYRRIRPSCDIHWHRPTRSFYFRTSRPPIPVSFLHNRSQSGLLQTSFFTRIVSQLDLVALTGTRQTQETWNYYHIPFHGGTTSVHKYNSIVKLILLNSTREVSLVVSCNNRVSQYVDDRCSKSPVHTTF